MKVYDAEADDYGECYPVVGGVLHSLNVAYQGMKWEQGPTGFYVWTFDRETGAFRYQWVDAGTSDAELWTAHLDGMAHRIVRSLFLPDGHPDSIFTDRDDDTQGAA